MSLFPELDTLEADENKKKPRVSNSLFPEVNEEDNDLFPELSGSEDAPLQDPVGRTPATAPRPTKSSAPALFPEAGDEGLDEGVLAKKEQDYLGYIKNLIKPALPIPARAALDAIENVETINGSPNEESVDPEKQQIRDTLAEQAAPAVDPISGLLLRTEPGKRAAAAMASGATGTAAGMVASVPAAEALFGTDTKMGQKAQEVAESLRNIAGEVMPENPDFVDQLASGAGSMALFMVPGTAAGRVVSAIPRMGVLATKLAPAIGASVSAVLESATESGGVYQDQVAKGMNRDLAGKSAFQTFWQNAILVGVTNKLGIFGDKAAAIKKAVTGASMEGLQEGAQSIISSVAKGEEIDWVNEVLPSIGVGMVLGGATAPIVQAAMEETAPVETTITDKTLGTKGSAYLKSRFPQLYDSINNQKAPLAEDQIRELLVQGAAAGEEVILKGGTPEEANSAALEAFSKAALPLMEEIQTKGTIQKEVDPLKPSMDELLMEFDPAKLESQKAAAPVAEMENDAIEPTEQAKDLKIRLRKADVEAEAQYLFERAKEDREGKLSPLETFVKQNGGIATYRQDADGRKEELEEYRNIPVRLRGQTSYDEMNQMARDAGVLPADAPYSALYDELGNLPQRGEDPKIEDFYDEARRNLEYERIQEKVEKGELSNDVAINYSATRVGDLRARAKIAAQKVLEANKIDDRVLIDLVDAIEVDTEAFKRGYGEDANPSDFDFKGVTIPIRNAKIQAVINLAKNATEATGRHEAFHAVSDILLDEAENNLIVKKYGDMEAAADAFGEFRAGVSTQDSLIDKIFQKIKNFLERLNNYLETNKFSTAEDLFKGIEEGRFAERARRSESQERFAQEAEAKPRFIGYQKAGVGEPPIALYSVKGAKGVDTWSRETLEEKGLEVPTTPSYEDWQSTRKEGKYSALQTLRKMFAKTQSVKPELRSPEFMRWFGGSKVVHQNGDPRIVFHGTQKQFNSFDPAFRELGFHFGADPRLSEARINRGIPALPSYEKGSVIMPVYLKLENPIQAKYDVGNWDVVEDAKDAIGWGDRTDIKTSEALRSALMSEGHDGIVYTNQHENVGKMGEAARESYIVFEPEQIKSAYNLGTFDPQNPDIRYSAARRPDLEHIKAAALRLADEIFIGVHHGDALVDAVVKGHDMDEKYESGFVTDRGRFLSREEALALAEEQGQLTSQPAGRMNSDDIRYSAQRIDPNQMSLFDQTGQATPEAKAQPGPVPKPLKEKKAPTNKPARAGEVADVGEELWYNRRNLTKGITWDKVKDLNPTLKVREVVKTKVWDRPDYEELVKGGMQPHTAHIIKQIYDAIAVAPASRGPATDEEMKIYMDTVAKVRDVVYEWAKDNTAQAAFIEGLTKNQGSMVSSWGASTAAMLDKIFPLAEGQRGRFSDGAYRDQALLLGGNKFVSALQPGHSSMRATMKAVNEGWPAKMEAWQKQFGVKSTPAGTKIYDNGAYRTLTELEYYVYRKATRAILASGFKSEASAKEHAKTLAERKLKEGTRERTALERWERQGPARRDPTENIEPQRLMDTFGFRGVNYGNWVKPQERQEFTNAAFDALSDLAELLNVPPKAISLNGLLGIAFGAQGRGGFAAAHFVPGVNEINLTKTAGAGALAHEWGHALDHYFANQAGEKIVKAQNPYLTHHANKIKESDVPGVRPEILKAFQSIVKTMTEKNETPDDVKARIDAQEKRDMERLERWLKGIRSQLERDAKPEGKEQALKTYDALADRIRKGNLGDGHIQTGRSQWDVISPVIADVRDLFRSARGRVLEPSEVKGLSANAEHIRFIKAAENQEKRHTPQRTDTDYAKAAQELDKAKGGKSYWTKETEYFARAFESYVLDRLKNQKHRNDYLTAPQGESQPAYPKGVERALINNSFDTLIKELKTKETSSGTALYSAVKKGPVVPTFYSQLESVLRQKLPDRAPISQILNILNGQEVKQDEVEWTGIKEWLREQTGPVTKEAVLDFLKQNQVQIQEVVKGKSGRPLSESEQAERVSLGLRGKLTPEQKARFDSLSMIQTGTPTKFDKYTLPGGEKYRELLFTLPGRGGWLGENTKGEGKIFPTEKEAKEFAGQGGEVSPSASGSAFKSSHFSEPNVLAHVRFNERTDSEGNKVLFIEEVQSDWHQKGREHGYAVDLNKPATPEMAKEFFGIRTDEWNKMSAEQKQTYVEDMVNHADYKSGRFPDRNTVPNAPFKKTWHELILKRMLRWAAENNFDKIAWTTGEQQAERYDLSKQIRSLVYLKDGDTYDINATDIEGRSVPIGVKINAKDLPEVIGKEAAQKIIEGKGEDYFTKYPKAVGVSGTRVLSGVDLKVGGEGMKGFYDQIIPSFLNKYTKKWGGRVGESRIASTTDRYGIKQSPDGEQFAVINLEDGSPEDVFDTEKAASAYAEKLNNRKPAGLSKVHSLDITPDMRKSVLEFGQPQYSAIKIVPRYEASKKPPEDFYVMNRKVQPGKLGSLKKDFGDTVSEVKMSLERVLGSISTRLKNIDPSLKRALRWYEFRTANRTMEDLKSVKPFLDKVATMKRDDRLDFDLARKNGDMQKIQALMSQYNFGAEYYRVRKTLNDIYKRAQDVGFNLGYLENYFPRKLKDAKGFVDFVQQQDDWSIINEALQKKEEAMGRYLTIEEKAEVINQMIRGYGKGLVSLSETGNMKDRLIDKVNPMMNRFYYDSDAAMVRYLNEVNSAIEARRFFGKGTAEKKGFDYGEGLGIIDIDNSIGGYILDLINRKVIKPSQEKELRDILAARFNPRGPGAIAGLFRNLSYIDAMGSPISAITQIGDLGLSLYRGGPIRTAFNLAKAAVGKSEVKREDIGIEKIAQEFSDPVRSYKALDYVFKKIGLDKMDALGKETYINTVLQKYRSQLKNTPREFFERLNEIFGEETPKVLADLKSGKITENIKYLLFSELANVQPITLSEMPEKYLSGGNGRIFYMLKSYTIKQLDIFRNESFQKIASPDLKTKAEGIRKLTYLAAALILSNGGADALKNLLLNRPTYLPDVVVDNMFRLSGISKYVLYDARRRGIGDAAMKMLLPPHKLIDSVYRDFINFNFEKDGMDSLEGNFWKGEKLETPASIPMFGKFYYWWFGKGTELSEKTRKKMAKQRALNQ